jgi:RNA polymerase sigma-70 factor (ECF subfamily)
VEELDPRVVRRARQGDAAAFEALVAHYQQRVFGLAWRLTYDAELARDITQDVFLRLYERLDRYDPSRPFGPWFMTLATNYALNARAKARTRATLSLDAPPPGQDAAPARADEQARPAGDAVADDEARALIRRTIQELPEKYAGVVVLHYFQGLGVKAIAERLAMPEGTVKIRLYRARNVLREKLQRFEQT